MVEEKKGWSPEQFNRRRYVVEGDSLDKAKRIELIVKVDGKMLVQMQAREPGMLSFVSKPTEQGFELDVVEATGQRYTDHASIGNAPEPVADWQFEAMGMPRSNG
jgi:hypothetical protein